MTVSGLKSQATRSPTSLLGTRKKSYQPVVLGDPPGPVEENTCVSGRVDQRHLLVGLTDFDLLGTSQTVPKSYRAGLHTFNLSKVVWPYMLSLSGCGQLFPVPFTYSSSH